MFDTPGLHTILDVGGDPAGAVALGQFAPRIKAMGYAMDYVINIRRPLSADAQAVLELMEQIEISARLLATGLINNTNLAAETTPQDILDGQAVVDAVGARRKLPLSYITAKPEVLAALPEDFQARYGARFFALTPRMRMPWLDEPLPMDARTRTR